jgi:hypothetical protein
MSGTRRTPARDTVAVRWARLSVRRLTWARRAYARFIDDLDERTRERFARGGKDGEAYVVVFGPTQVGKTTLILDLMGVSPLASARVSGVLRGGRDLGCSATATAMEYRRSGDACWRLKSVTQDATFATDDEMTRALADVRESMSQGRLVCDEPIVVGIPDECFDPDATIVRARMLDLPGADPMEAAERAHVADMAKLYVGNADLILLVGLADGLTFLHPKTLDLPGVRDWRSVPERFRVVTTRSFTPQTVRDMIDMRTDPLDAAFFRQALRREISTFDFQLSDDAQSPERFFPLEIGDSWRLAAQQYPELHAKIDPIVRELKDELRADIANSATEYARMRSTARLHEVAREVKRIGQEEHEKRLTALRDARESLRADLRNLGAARVSARRVLGVRRKELALAPLRKSEIVAQLGQPERDVDFSMIEDVGQSRAKFRSAIGLFSAALSDRSLTIGPRKELRSTGFWARLRPDELPGQDAVRRAIRAEFRSLEARLDAYRLDAYFPKLSGDFARDKATLRETAEGAVPVAGNAVADHWASVAAARVSALEEEVAHAAASRLAMLRTQMDAREDCKRASLAIHDGQAECDAFCARMDEEGRKGEKFVRWLDENYAAELRARATDIALARTPVDMFIGLMSAAQLIEEKNKLLFDKKTKT